MALLDDSIFQQLLDMDDDDEHEFSKSIVEDFFIQIDENLPKFQELMEKKDYDAIGKLGHFLKGSSASVGAERIRNITEDINHYDIRAPDGDYEGFLNERIRQLHAAVPETKKFIYGKIGLLQ